MEKNCPCRYVPLQQVFANPPVLLRQSFAATSMAIHVNHDKYKDINGSGAAPYKASLCITYVVLLGLFS